LPGALSARETAIWWSRFCFIAKQDDLLANKEPLMKVTLIFFLLDLLILLGYGLALVINFLRRIFGSHTKT
jgi:hypothetical protein